MVRKKPKTPQKKVPDRGERLTIDDCNQWTEFLIAGKHYPRLVSHGVCEECHAKNKFHFLGCTEEICPACLDQAWFCNCSGEMEVDIVCET